MATVIAIANQKGGPGKTTTAINFSRGLELAKYSVFVIDADPQATCRKWYRRAVQKQSATFVVESVVQGELIDRVTELKREGKYDVILIDCPGYLGPEVTHTLELADVVLMPMKATGFDFEAAEPMVKFVQDVRKRYPDLRLLLFINECHPNRNLDKGAVRNARRLFGEYDVAVLDSKIADLAAIAEFGPTGKTVFENAPGSTATEQYIKLTKEIITCLAQKVAVP